MQISNETRAKLERLRLDLQRDGMDRKTISWRLLNHRMVLEPDMRTRKQRALAAQG